MNPRAPQPTPTNGDIVIHKPGAPNPAKVGGGILDWIGNHASLVGHIAAILVVMIVVTTIFNKLPKSVLIILVLGAGVATGVISWNIK